MMRALLHWLRWRVPDHPFLYTLAQRYVMQYLGEDTEDMLLNGEWLCIRHFIPAARTVFDVGANVGEWLLSFEKSTLNAKSIASSRPHQLSSNCVKLASLGKWF